MKQHLGRQSGVQKVDVSLIDGKVDITPKEDGQIDPAQLLKATYDSSGSLTLQVEPNRSFSFVQSELSKSLDSLVDTQAMVTVRGQLYKKPPGKKQKVDASIPLKLLILEVEKKE